MKRTVLYRYWKTKNRPASDRQSMFSYFDDLAEALQRDSVSESELVGIAEAHQMEIVGRRPSGTSRSQSRLL